MMGESFSNGLSPAQAERLALLAEECGEAVQAIGKILRHGLSSCSPLNHPDDAVRNDVALAREVGDVFAAVDLLYQAGVLDARDVYDARLDKLQRVERWLHHTAEPR